MKQKRFKEYRMLIVCIVLVLLVLVLEIPAIIEHNIMRIIAFSILLLIGMSLLMFRYYIILDDDYMVNYKWMIAAMMPYIIEYKDIESIEKVSKHCVSICHNDVSKVYIRNSDLFINELNKRLHKEL